MKNIISIIFQLFFLGTLLQAQSYDVEWTNLVNVTQSGNTVMKSTANGWNAGASSVNILPSNSDGYIEVTITGDDFYRYIGLSEVDQSPVPADIDYSFYVLSSGGLNFLMISEKGDNMGQFGQYQTGDKLKISRVNNQIQYFKNDSLLNSSTVTSSSALVVDVSLYDLDSRLDQIKTSFSQNTDTSSAVTATTDHWTNGNNMMYHDGKIVIGSATTKIPGDYNLYVTKGILSEHVRVALTSGNWSDYVFEEDYLLHPIPYVEKYIAENKHLPNVPSASTVEQEGVDLGSMQAVLLRQIEELWLHTIELNKKIESMEEQLKACDK